MRDADVRFHQEWLGLAQPVEGLVFSVPALADAQIAPKIRPGLTADLEAQLEDTDHGPALRHVRGFFETFLGYSHPGMLVGREELPADMHFYAKDGRQEIRPSFAIARGPFEDAADDAFAAFQAGPEPTESLTSDDKPPYLALVWDLSTDAGAAAVGIDLDGKETETGSWRYPTTAKLERLLRHTGIPIGFVSNRRELRIVYAPAGESSAHLTFRFKDLAERAGRPLVAALELLFHAERTYGAAPEFTFEGLLRDSRLRQADVTKDLAAQVFEAVEILLEGFEHAAARDCVGDRPDWLRAALEEPGDHLYQGILSVVLRLVFILYAEDQSLLPVNRPAYDRHLSVVDLYERLSDDAGSHPESMHLRFGAYGRLIALFRVIFLGVQREDLALPPRRGKLFDPSAFPFLEGGLPGWTAAIVLPEERAAVQLPSIDDSTIYRVLHRLVVFKGQRLSYRSLDVEQIGAVYESLMGYHVLRLESPAVRLGQERVWAETKVIRAMTSADRKRFWKEMCGLSKGSATKAEAAIKATASDASLGEALGELTPRGNGTKTRHRAAAGRLVLQPGEERRRTGSHYTPRWLSEKVVKRTLDPILACLGENRTAEQILSLKICDPAMGSGAFLVAACRLLAEEVVQAWDRAEKSAAMTDEHGDPLLHARRLVAQQCLYGVDKNAAAVELAKLSLWLVTLSEERPFSFLDHALRHGDSLVGLDLDQIRGFHWKPKNQLETFNRALEDALGQALEHRDGILALADNGVLSSEREKQRLLEYAEQATARIRLIADVCIGAFFANGKASAREIERNARLELVRRLLDGDESVRDELTAMAVEIRAQHAPFHWMIEFPEVFYLERPDPLNESAIDGAAYMEAFVGNPPFLGGTRISVANGTGYRDWLALNYDSSGLTDLCAFFFRRCFGLLGSTGALGLIATDTISQGSTRTTSLGWIRKHDGAIYDAETRFAWPGDASVMVSVVHITKGQVHAAPVLDGVPVPQITAFLRTAGGDDEPERLEANKDIAVIGSFVLGIGFVFDDRSPEANPIALMKQLIEKNPRNRERIFGYFGGEELNTVYDGRPRRFIIDFGELSDAEAASWPDLYALVEERVKPARANVKQRDRRELWWLHATRSPKQRAFIAANGRCLALSQLSSHLALCDIDPDTVVGHTAVMILVSCRSAFAILQSRIHESWAKLLSSSLGQGLRYTPSTSFQTFPFPQRDPRTIIYSLEAIGDELYETRASYMRDTKQGLTKTYNALKDPHSNEPRILELRRLHTEMDRTVLGAYGWSGIEVPPFCARTDQDRAALQAFEDEVIDRLYVLNAERARQERKLGEKTVKGARANRRARKSRNKPAADTAAEADDKQEELF